MADAKMIDTVRWTSDMDVSAVLASGRGVVFYAGYKGLKQRTAQENPDADVWYTERNGDPIGLLVPKGLPTDQLPNEALGYWIMEWIDPDLDFGTGVRPQHCGGV